MLPDEGGNRVELDGWRLETAVLVGHDNVLVSTDSFSVAAQAYIRRIAQAITLVKRVACVLQYVLDVKTASVVCKCLFVCHLLNVNCCLSAMT